MTDRVQTPTPAGMLWTRPDVMDHIDKAVIDEHFKHDTYRVLGENMRGKTIVDCGANIGVFSVLCASQGASRVIAIEPEPDNLELLRLNTQHWSAVQILPFALGAEHGTAYLTGEAGGARTVDECDIVHTEGVAVAQLTLKQVLDSTGLGHFDLLKLDMEGAEVDTLLATPHDRLARCGRLVMETHPLEPPKVTRVGELVEHLVWTHNLQVEGFPNALGKIFGTRSGANSGW